MKNNDHLEYIVKHIANSMLSQETTAILNNFPKNSRANYTPASVVSFNFFKAMTTFAVQHPQAAYNMFKIGLLPDTDLALRYKEKLSQSLAKQISQHEKFPEFLKDNQENLDKLEALCRTFKLVTDEDSSVLKNVVKPKYATAFFKDSNLMKIALQSYAHGHYLSIINAMVNKFASDNSFRKTCIELINDVAKDTFKTEKSTPKTSTDKTDLYHRSTKVLFNNHNKPLKHHEPLVSLLSINNEEVSRKTKK